MTGVPVPSLLYCITRCTYCFRYEACRKSFSSENVMNPGRGPGAAVLNDLNTGRVITLRRRCMITSTPCASSMSFNNPFSGNTTSG